MMGKNTTLKNFCTIKTSKQS